ncbi:MAG: SCO family protein [Limisphaerales bacterium]
MSAVSNRTQMLGWGLLLVTLALVLGGYFHSSSGYSGRSAARPVLGELPEFTLTNQMGQAMTRNSLRGQVWLADIIFTRCAGPCPRLTRRMGELQAALPADVPAKFLSFTVDPEFDTPPILSSYARRFGAAPGRWLFLTGTRHELYEVIVRGLKLVATPTDPAAQKPDEDLFLHSTKMVLIDQQGHIRAYYDGLDPASKPVILADLAAVTEETSP